MVAKYKLWGTGEWGDGVSNTETNSCIPEDTSNSDWLEYLEWTTISGNVADPQFTEQEIEDNSWAAARYTRDALLTSTDWTQLADSPIPVEDETTWSTYRQDLRDIPQDYSTASGIMWPEMPTYSGTG
jgi:hypothetical protein